MQEQSILYAVSLAPLYIRCIGRTPERPAAVQIDGTFVGILSHSTREAIECPRNPSGCKTQSDLAAISEECRRLRAYQLLLLREIPPPYGQCTSTQTQ